MSEWQNLDDGFPDDSVSGVVFGAWERVGRHLYWRTETALAPASGFAPTHYYRLPTPPPPESE